MIWVLCRIFINGTYYSIFAHKSFLFDIYVLILIKEIDHYYTNFLMLMYANKYNKFYFLLAEYSKYHPILVLDRVQCSL